MRRRVEQVKDESSKFKVQTSGLLGRVVVVVTRGGLVTLCLAHQTLIVVVRGAVVARVVAHSASALPVVGQESEEETVISICSLIEYRLQLLDITWP